MRAHADKVQGEKTNEQDQDLKGIKKVISDHNESTLTERRRKNDDYDDDDDDEIQAQTTGHILLR